MTRTHFFSVVMALSYLAPLYTQAQVPRIQQTPFSAVRGLQSLNANERQAAAESLAKFRRNNAAVNALAATLLQDPNPAVRLAAAKVLTRMGSRARQVLATAAICDPESGVRKTLASYGRRAKVACQLIPEPSDTATPLPRAEAQLLPYLDHPSPATRMAAARDLARMRSSRGYRAIWSMVNLDPVWKIRSSSIRILTRVYGKKLLSVLHFTLNKDPDARVRQVAMEALGFLKDSSTVAWLANSAKFEQLPETQRSAVKALLHIGDRAAVSALSVISETNSNEETRAAAISALHSLKKHRKLSRPVIARVLKHDRSGKVRAAAMKALSTDTSATACSARAERINDPDAEVRQTVVEQLEKCPWQIAYPALTAAARDDREAVVRRAAIALLIKKSVTKAKDVLLTALQSDKDLSIRQMILKAVDKLPQKDQAPPLAEVALRDPDAKMRQRAVHQLGKLSGNVSMATLQTVLSSDQAELVRAQAAKSLSNFTEPSVYAALRSAATNDSAERVRRIAADGAAKSPAQKAFVDSLLPQTIDTSVSVRLKAVTQLCALKVPRTYRALVRALWMDPNAAVRTAIAKCFATIDHPLVDIGLSVAHSTDSDGGLIRTVELSQQQRMQRLTLLLKELKNAQPAKRIEAIKQLQPSPNRQVRTALEQLLRADPDPGVRLTAAKALLRYMDRRALQKLMQASQQERDPNVRRKVGGLYHKLRRYWAAGREALNINRLIVALRSGTAREKIDAAWMLGTLRDRRAFQPLRDASTAEDPSLRYAAIVALATFGDVRIVSKSVSDEKDKEMRERLIQLNFLRKAPEQKVIDSLKSETDSDVKRSMESAGIRQINKAVPWLVKQAIANISKDLRRAAVRTLALYDLPLARWAIRVASQNDASKRLRSLMWRWAVFTDSDNT